MNMHIFMNTFGKWSIAIVVYAVHLAKQSMVLLNTKHRWDIIENFILKQELADHVE